MTNRALGRGLSTLLKEQLAPTMSASNELIKIIDIDSIDICEFQPRKKFEADKIQELANSINANGLLQPILVTYNNDNKKYQIVAGERRWRACKLAQMLEIPVIVRNFKDDEILKIALLENIQREELTVIEEAEGYKQLIEQFDYTQEDLSHKIGKSRSHIANLIRLTGLSQSIKDKLNEGQLSMGHARCLVGHVNSDEIADFIIEKNLNVRQTEKLVKNWVGNQPILKNPKYKNKDASAINSNFNDDIKMLADNLSEKFNLKVTIENSLGNGKIIFHYSDHEELDQILMRLI